MSENISAKTCNDCGFVKPLACYAKRTASKDGLAPRCKPCDIIRKRAWVANNTERKAAYDKQWIKNNSKRMKKLVNDLHYSIEPGVYMIKNIITGDCYIGTSKHPYLRAKQHLSYREETTKQFCSPDALIYDVQQYGKESFIFGILEHCDKTQLFERETHYICIYQPTYNTRKTCN